MLPNEELSVDLVTLPFEYRDCPGCLGPGRFWTHDSSVDCGVNVELTAPGCPVPVCFWVHDGHLNAGVVPTRFHTRASNGEHCTGDAIRMGGAIRSKTIDLESVQVLSTGLVKPDEPLCENPFSFFCCTIDFKAVVYAVEAHSGEADEERLPATVVPQSWTTVDELCRAKRWKASLFGKPQMSHSEQVTDVQLLVLLLCGTWAQTARGPGR